VHRVRERQSGSERGRHREDVHRARKRKMLTVIARVLRATGEHVIVVATEAAAVVLSVARSAREYPPDMLRPVPRRE